MSLMEVLISLFILAFALLGVNATQLLSFRKAQTVYYVNVALQQIEVVRQKLQASKDSNISAIIRQWNEQNREVLPNGIGIIQNKNHFLVISIFWGVNHPPFVCQKNKIGPSGCLISS